MIKRIINIVFIIFLLAISACDQNDGCVARNSFSSYHIKTFKIQANPFQDDGSFEEGDNTPYQKGTFSCNGREYTNNGYHWFDTGLDIGEDKDGEDSSKVAILVKGATSSDRYSYGEKEIFASNDKQEIFFNGVDIKKRDVALIIERAGYETKSVAFYREFYKNFIANNASEQAYTESDKIDFVRKELLSNTHTISNASVPIDQEFLKNNIEIQNLLTEKNFQNIAKTRQKIIEIYYKEKIFNNSSLTIDEDNNIIWQDQNIIWYKNGENLTINGQLFTDTTYFSRNKAPFYLDDNKEQIELSSEYYSKKNCCLNHNGSSLEPVKFFDKITFGVKKYKIINNKCCLKKDQDGKCMVIDEYYDDNNPRYSYVVNSKKIAQDSNLSKYSKRNYSIFNYCTRDIYYPKASFLPNEEKNVNISVNEAFTEIKPSCDGVANAGSFFGKRTCWRRGEDGNASWVVGAGAIVCENCCYEGATWVFDPIPYTQAIETDRYATNVCLVKENKQLYTDDISVHIYATRIDLGNITPYIPSYFCPEGTHYQEKAARESFFFTAEDDSILYEDNASCPGNQASTKFEIDSSLANKAGCWRQTGTYALDPFNLHTISATSCRVSDAIHSSSYFDNYGKYKLRIVPFYTPYENAYKVVEFRIGEDIAENKKILEKEFYQHYPWLDESVVSGEGMKRGRIYFRSVNKEVIDASLERGINIDQARCVVAAEHNYDISELYKNNAGTIIIKLKVAKLSEAKIDFKQRVDELFSDILSIEKKQIFFEGIVQDGRFQNAVRAIFTLYIVFFGLMVLMGTAEIKKSDLLARAIKIALIYTIISPDSWKYFSQIVYFFEDGSQELAVRLFSSSDKGLIFSQINGILNYIVQPDILKKILAMMITPIIIGTIMGIIVLFSLFLILYSLIKIIIIYFYIKIIFVILFFVAPFFIICAFFNVTFNLFKKWLDTVISYSLQLFTMFVGISLFLTIILSSMTSLFYYSVCWQSVWAIGPINILYFYKYRGYSEQSSAGGNFSLGPSFTEILFFFALAYIFRYAMDKFVELGRDLSDSGVPAASSLAKNAIDNIQGAMQGVTKGVFKKLWSGAKFTARKGFGINTRLSITDRIQAMTGYNAQKAQDNFLRNLSTKVNKALKEAKKEGLSKEEAKKRAKMAMNQELSQYPASMKKNFERAWDKRIDRLVDKDNNFADEHKGKETGVKSEYKENIREEITKEVRDNMEKDIRKKLELELHNEVKERERIQEELLNNMKTDGNQNEMIRNYQALLNMKNIRNNDILSLDKEDMNDINKINKSYRLRALKLHPDKITGEQEKIDAAEIFKAIGKAKEEVLNNLGKEVEPENLDNISENRVQEMLNKEIEEKMQKTRDQEFQERIDNEVKDRKDDIDREIQQKIDKEIDDVIEEAKEDFDKKEKYKTSNDDKEEKDKAGKDNKKERYLINNAKFRAQLLSLERRQKDLKSGIAVKKARGEDVGKLEQELRDIEGNITNVKNNLENL